MGYEVLIEALLKEGKNKSQEIIEKGRLEAETVLKKADERSFRYEQEKQKEIKKEIEARKARILSRAKIECLRILLESRHEVLNSAFKRAGERLERWMNESSGKEEHRRFWIRRVEESLQGHESADFRAFLFKDAPKDLEVIFHEMGIPFERVNDPYLRYGFKLVSEKEGLTVINSFPARLEKIQHELMVDLQRTLGSSQ